MLTNERRQIIFMVASSTVGIALLIFDSVMDHGWVSATWWGCGLFAVYCAYALWARDGLIGRFLVFTTAAGFAELFADYYLVSVTRTLVYPRPEPLLWDSPFYMPFSWAVVLLQMGYAGWWLTRWRGPWVAGLLLMPLSGLLIPLYERWAISAGWWHYENVPEWWGVPRYIFLAEALLVFPVPFFLRKIKRWPDGLGWGLAEGVVMLLACLLAIKITGS